MIKMATNTKPKGSSLWLEAVESPLFFRPWWKSQAWKIKKWSLFSCLPIRPKKISCWERNYRPKTIGSRFTISWMWLQKDGNTTKDISPTISSRKYVLSMTQQPFTSTVDLPQWTNSSEIYSQNITPSQSSSNTDRHWSHKSLKQFITFIISIKIYLIIAIPLLRCLFPHKCCFSASCLWTDSKKHHFSAGHCGRISIIFRRKELLVIFWDKNSIIRQKILGRSEYSASFSIWILIHQSEPCSIHINPLVYESSLKFLHFVFQKLPISF